MASRLRATGEPSRIGTQEESLAMLRTYGRTSLRSLGATTFLAFAGLAAALIPLALHAVFVPDQPPGDLLYFSAAVIAGAVVGLLVRR
jgi:hypothetical protein